MTQTPAPRQRRADAIATPILLILAALVQLFSKIADDNMKSFGAEFGGISKSDIHMLTVLDWGGWVLLVAVGGLITGVRRGGWPGWPWALGLLAALIAIALWSTTFAGA